MQNSIVEGIYNIGAIKLGSFTLKSGDVSPFYFDLRLIPSEIVLFKSVIDAYADLILSLDYTPDAIAGIMSAGIPFATGVSLKLGIPLLQIRSEVKKHGTSKLIEGILPQPGSKVVLLDDLISTGASKSEPVNILRDQGIVVTDLVVLIDRTNQIGADVLKKLSLNLHSTFKLLDLLKQLKQYVNENELAILEKAVFLWQAD